MTLTTTSAARLTYRNAARRAYHDAVRRNAERLHARDVFKELSGDALDPAAALETERIESPRNAISDRERFARALAQSALDDAHERQKLAEARFGIADAISDRSRFDRALLRSARDDAHGRLACAKARFARADAISNRIERALKRC